MKLVDHVVRSFKVAKIFRENSDRINSIDFSPNGDTLISCSEDDQIVIYDCEKGTQVRTVNSKKYGVDLIHFTHAKNTAIHSSTKVDDTIRYLSLHDNKQVSKIVGSALTELSRGHERLGPAGRGLRSRRSYLRSGSQFREHQAVRSAQLRQGTLCHLQALSGEGMRLDRIEIQQTFAGYLNNKGIAIEASFSPDSQFVFSGSTDGRVHVWNAETGYKVCVLNGDHPAPVQCIQFNPKYMMLASACTNMAFWLPTVDESA